jgi:hypothetical protein
MKPRPIVRNRRLAWAVSVAGWVAGTLLLYDEWARRQRR